VLIVVNQHRSMSQIIFSTIFAKVLSFASLLTPLSGLAMLVVPKLPARNYVHPCNLST
jgi:hypothetical protein